MTILGARHTENLGYFDADSGNFIYGDYVVRPRNIRETILYLFPQGSAPLIALTARSGKKADDPEIFWGEKALPEQAGEVIDLFTDPGFAAPYAGGGVYGTVLYAQVNAETASHFREGHQALLRITDDFSADVNARVFQVVSNGDNSIIGVTLLEDDDNSFIIPPNTLVLCDTIAVIGDINPEMGAMPDGISYDPTKYMNYTQIFRTPLSMSNTARATRKRWESYEEMQREALQLHSVLMERASIHGVRTMRMGDNNQPERTMMGLIPWIRSYSPNISDYRTDSDAGVPAGTTWADGAGRWFEYWLSRVFNYGEGKERWALCGNGVLLSLNAFLRSNPNVNWSLDVEDKMFGIQVVTWKTQFGKWNFMTHPLFSLSPVTQKACVVFDINDITPRPLRDTRFISDQTGKSGGHTFVDGVKEEYLTEISMEFNFPVKCALLSGWGFDRP